MRNKGGLAATRTLVVFAFSCVLLPAAAQAQAQAQAQENWPDGPPVHAIAISPADAVTAFLHAVRRGDTSIATRFLEVPPELEARAPLLARRLAAVLTYRLADRMALTSKAPMGDRDDNLPPDLEQIGVLATSAFGEQPVRLHHEISPFSWVFSRRTVDYIDDWYERMPARWIVDYLPAELDAPTFGGLMLWQALAIPIAMALALLFAIACSRLSCTVARRLAARAAEGWDGELTERYRGPITAAWFVAWTALLKSLLVLPVSADAIGDRLIRAGGLLVLLWAMERSVSVIRDRIVTWPAVCSGAAPMLTRTARIVVLLVVLVTALAEIGYPVTGIIVGLALVAFAITVAVGVAAHKTLENLFSGFVLSVDQPFREGDVVKVDDIVGTVESLGMHSTRIRTLDRALVTVPNGRLAVARIESYDARDGLCLSTMISLDRTTTPSQMHAVLDGLERILQIHPQVIRDSVVVRFATFGMLSLDIDVTARFHTASWDEFQLIRQTVLLEFMDIVASSGTWFALPARSVPALHAVRS